MKKLIVMVVLVCLGMISYSEGECKWISDPSVYERKEIALVVANKLTDKIYCDEDGDRMVYETGDQWNKELEIGLAYNAGDDSFYEIETKFTNDINKILPNNISGSDIIMKPRYYNFRLYVIFEDGESYMHLKSTADTKDNSWTDYYNSEIRDLDPELADVLEKEGYFYTEDVIY
ncbi:MAG: hypothetical protein WAR82_06300 [Leptotrichiaceae bacterium]|jgi:hypothetical protein